MRVVPFVVAAGIVLAAAPPAYAAPTPTPTIGATSTRAATPRATASATPTPTPSRTATPRAGSPIDARWAQLGGPTGWVGAPTSVEYAQNGGRVRTFEGADIGWTTATGAKYVKGLIRERHRELGGMGGFLAYPTTDEIDGWLPGTRRSDFTGGSLYYTWPRAYTIYGSIRERYAALGSRDRSEMGLPTSDEVDGPVAGARRNRFEHGSVVWSPASGAHAIYGAIHGLWDADATIRREAGLPVSDEEDSGFGGRRNRLERGQIQWHPAYGPHAVYGAIHQRYAQVAPTLGAATSDEQPGTIPGVRVSRFERGAIFWSPATGAHEVFGMIGWQYAQLGQDSSELGLPLTGEYPVPGGVAEDFQYGRIVYQFDGGRLSVELQRNPESSPLWRDCTLTLNGARVTWRAGQRTYTVVNGTGGSYADLRHYVRRNSACGYDQTVGAVARVGYNGISDGATRVQGSGTTPAGTYTLSESYGSGANPGSGLPYVTYNSTDRWVMDSNSVYYNNFRNPSQGGFSTVDNEPLADSPVEFEYFIPVNFNRAPDFVRKDRGAGVFLHVNGPGATAACISITREQIVSIMRSVRPWDQITIVP